MGPVARLLFARAAGGDVFLVVRVIMVFQTTIAQSERGRRPLLILAGIVLALIAAVLLAAAVGAVAYTPAQILQVALHPNEYSQASTVLWALRFPRVLLAALVGASLAVAGGLLQGMLRNPLVDPYLTGSSAGAAFAVAVAVVIGVAAPLYVLCAFVAALATAAVVAALARTGSGISTERLILAGISISSLFAGLVTLIIMLAPATSTSLTILAWLGGSLAGRGWSDLTWSALYAAVAFSGALTLAPTLNALRLGDARARALGVDVDRAQWGIVAIAALLTAAAVSVSGIIGFVGLIVPHVARRAIGSDARWTLIACGLLGAIGVVVADMIARILVPPLELPIGILLSILGVPAFIYLAFHKPRRA